MSAGKLFLLLLINIGFCLPAYPDTSGIEEVTVEGIGSGVQDASKDAAQKALIKVIGSLLDVQTQLEKTIEIKEFTRKESSYVKSAIREYSQGSIQSLEVLDVKNNGDIFTVTAKVTVKKEELDLAVKKNIGTNLNIDSVGLLVQASNEDDQKHSQADIFVDRVLKPIVDYEFTHFTVSKPTKVDEEFKTSNQGGRVPRRLAFIQNLRNRYGDDFRLRNIYQVTVSSELSNEFVKQYRKTLSALSQGEDISATLNFVMNPLLMSGSSEGANDNLVLSLIRMGRLHNDDVVLISSAGVNENVGIQTKLNSMNALNSKVNFRFNVLKGVRPELKNKSKQLDILLDTPAKTKSTSKNIIVNFLDEESESINSYNCGDENDDNSSCLAESIDFTGLSNGASIDSFEVKPWRLLDTANTTSFLSSFSGSDSPGFLVLFEKRFFNLYFYVPTSQLEKSKRIEIKIGG